MQKDFSTFFYLLNYWSWKWTIKISSIILEDVFFYIDRETALTYITKFENKKTKCMKRKMGKVYQ